jgi:hypothetical protein
VIKLPLHQTFTDEYSDKIGQKLAERFGPETHVIVLNNGIEMEILRPPK